MPIGRPFEKGNQAAKGRRGSPRALSEMLGKIEKSQWRAVIDNLVKIASTEGGRDGAAAAKVLFDASFKALDMQEFRDAIEELRAKIEGAPDAIAGQ